MPKILNFHYNEGMSKVPAVNIDRLNQQLEKKRWGPGDLATYSGVSYDTIYKIRIATRPRTSAEILGKLAQALGTSVDYLLELTDDPTPASLKELPEELREMYEYFKLLSPLRQMFMVQLARLMSIDQAQSDASQRQRWMHTMLDEIERMGGTQALEAALDEVEE